MIWTRHKETMRMLTGSDEICLTLESTETSATMTTGHFLASSLKTQAPQNAT